MNATFIQTRRLLWFVGHTSPHHFVAFTLTANIAIFYFLRDLRWYLVSQPPRPEVALIFPGSTTQKKDCHVRPCYVCNEHPDVIWMVQPGGAKEKLRETKKISRQKMKTSLIKRAKIAKNVEKYLQLFFSGALNHKEILKESQICFSPPIHLSSSSCDM